MKGFKGQRYLITTINGESINVTYEWDEIFEEIIIMSVWYKGTEIFPLINDKQVEELTLKIYEQE